jgi:hypothetical protein
MINLGEVKETDEEYVGSLPEKDQFMSLDDRSEPLLLRYKSGNRMSSSSGHTPF